MDALEPLQDGGARISHGRSFRALARRAGLSRRRGSLETAGIASGARVSDSHLSCKLAPQMPVMWQADSGSQTKALVCEVLLCLPMHITCHNSRMPGILLRAEP